MPCPWLNAPDAAPRHGSERIRLRFATGNQVCPCKILAGHFIIDAVAAVGDRAAKFFFRFGSG